jgi:hypothetical protein
MWTVSEYSDNPVSIGKIHLVQTCCQIFKVDSNERVALILTAAVDEGTGDPSQTIMEIWKLLEPLRTKLRPLRV